MPGICGIVDRTNRVPLAARMAEMLSALRSEPWHQEQSLVLEADRLALGRTTLGFVNAEVQPVQSADGQLIAVMDGELYDVAKLQAELRSAGCELKTGSHAELLLAGFEQQGQAFFRRLHGSFTAAIWNHRQQRLILTADRFGLRPLYYAHPRGKLIFAASLQAILCDKDISTTPNPQGLAQFFSFGHYWNEETSLADVRIAPSAAWLTYDAHEDRLTVESYLELAADLPTLPASEAGILEALDEAFAAAVRRRQEETNHLGLALSGGLDARMILGTLDLSQQRVKTISYGIAGSLDHRCATRLSELVGCEHVNHVLGADFLANFPQHLDRMIGLTDGQYLSQCIVLPTLPLYRQLGIEVLMRGHAGELMHMHKAYAYSLDQQALGICDDRSLATWLNTHLQGYMLSAVEGPIFRDLSTAEVAELVQDSLDTALRPAEAHLSPLQRIWYLFVTQRLRRETSLSLAKFGSTVEVRVPYLDNDLIRLLLAVPPEMKLGERIQRYIMAKRCPEFLQVVNSNTGTRIGASQLARTISTLRMRVFAKLGLPGYQPYERLGLWLRRELKPLVHSVLLGDTCLNRGVFNPDTLRTIVRQHESAQRNHTYLIMAMMIYELGQQRLFNAQASGHGLPLLDSSPTH
jgi:asparagine synthase (glutamine-hydrolysing)